MKMVNKHSEVLESNLSTGKTPTGNKRPDIEPEIQFYNVEYVDDTEERE